MCDSLQSKYTLNTLNPSVCACTNPQVRCSHSLPYMHSNSIHSVYIGLLLYWSIQPMAAASIRQASYAFVAFPTSPKSTVSKGFFEAGRFNRVVRTGFSVPSSVDHRRMVKLLNPWIKTVQRHRDCIRSPSSIEGAYCVQESFLIANH